MSNKQSQQPNVENFVDRLSECLSDESRLTSNSEDITKAKERRQELLSSYKNELGNGSVEENLQVAIAYCKKTIEELRNSAEESKTPIMEELKQYVGQKEITDAHSKITGNVIRSYEESLELLQGMLDQERVM